MVGVESKLGHYARTAMSLKHPAYRRIALGASLAVTLSACSSTGLTSTDTSDFESYSCSDLAGEAVSGGAKSRGVKLLKVRNPHVLKDNRSTVETSTGDGENLVLSCEGAGVWSDGTTVPTLLKYTVDSAGNTFVEWQAR